MSSTLLANMRSQWDASAAKMKAITENAAADNRDLNDVERANFDALQTELDSLRPRIEQLVEVERSLDSTAELFSKVSDQGRSDLIRSEAPKAITEQWKTPGEYLYDVLRSFGPNQDPGARQRLERAALLQRDETTTVNGGTLQNVTLAEIAAHVPNVVTGEMWSNIDRRRPIYGTMRLREITSPMMFVPRVTQHTQVGPQGAGAPAGAAGGTGQLGYGDTGAGVPGAITPNDEKAVFVSRKMILSRLNIEPVAVGGVVDVSLWAEMLTPNLLDMIIEDLAGEYAIQTEAMSAAELNRVGTANVIDALDGTAGSGLALPGAAGTGGAGSASNALLLAGLYQAAGGIYANTGRLPDTVAISADVWAMLGQMTDGGGRPLFPTLGAQNASATMAADRWVGSIAGLNVIVSPALAAKSIIVYASEGFHAYERRLGVLQVIEPERAGRVVSYSGLFQGLAMDDGIAASVKVA